MQNPAPPRGRLPRLRGWIRWVEPWYLSYGLLGVTTGGLVMIFLPLGIDKTGSATHVGLVMAVVGAGQLTAGLWGTLADRYRLHRALFVGGTVAAVVAFVGFSLEPHVLGWLFFATILGVGTAAANTVSNLFIVENHAKPEWDERIAWLQTFSNAGAVGGLLLAGALAAIALREDFLIGAVFTGVAALVGWATTRTPARGAQPKPPGTGVGPEPEWATNTPQRTADYVTTKTLKHPEALLESRYGIFVLAWLVANLGLAAVNALYPVMMLQLFDTEPSVSSVIMGVATGASLLLYAPSSMLVTKVGEPRVFQLALVGRAAALAVLTLLGFASFGARDWLAGITWFAVVLAGPLFTVSGTVMASNLATKSEGEAIGQYNAAGSLGALVGSATGGFFAARWGYAAAPALGAAGVGAGLLLSLLIGRITPAATPAAGPQPARG